MNSHIETYLNDYIAMPSPNFAVLIKGEWGSGKTHYIKKVVKRLVTDKKKDYVYVSLYGVDELSQIDDLILAELSPIGQSLKFLGKVTYGAAKFLVSETCGKVAEKLVEGVVGAVSSEKSSNLAISKSDNVVLIFDDLERCTINPEVVKGYINYFVEHQSCKVLILANSDELKNKDTNEKIIGKTFHVTADVDNAYDIFLKDEELKSTADVLINHKKIVVDLFKRSEFNNLRLLKQSFSDFNSFYKQLGQAIKDKPDLIEHLITLFFIFSFEEKNKSGGLARFIAASKRIYGLIEKYKNTPPDEDQVYYNKILKKYGNAYRSKLLLNDYWIDVISKNKYNNRIIEGMLEDSHYFYEERTEDWQKLTNYSTLTIAQDNALLPKVFQKFKNEELEFKGLLSVTNYMYFLSDQEIIPISIDKVTKIAENTIIKQKEHIPLDIDFSVLQHTHQGVEITKVIDYLKEVVDNKKISEDAVQELLNALQSNVQTFTDMLHLKYLNIPILSKIDVEEFITVLMNLSFYDIEHVFKTLADRYAPERVSHPECDTSGEFEWAKTLVTKFEESIKEPKTSLLHFLTPSFDEIKKHTK